MVKKVKPLIFSLFLLLASLAFTKIAFSQGGELEVVYPTLPYTTPPASPETSLSLYLKYIYNFSIYLAGFLIFLLLIYGGLRYITSSGNPARMAEAKEQIQEALIGFFIIFSAYLILNTINPQLVLFPFLGVIPLEETPIPELTPQTNITWSFKELPIGAMITSEKTPSSFLYAFFGLIPTTTDPDTSLEDYAFVSLGTTTDLYVAPYKENPNATTTQYQGILEGRRLKRIHEITTTTLPAFELLATTSEQFVLLMEEFHSHVEKLYQYAQECDCDNCDKPDCPGNHVCDCSVCQCLDTSDPCPHRDEMEELRNKILPSYYENATDPINCGIYMMKYLALHIKRFLDSEIERPLVKNDDHQDESFWYSEEAQNLRAQIEACINASSDWEDWIEVPLRGDDLRDLFEKIEEVIWKNATTSLAAVENKGTYAPKTDPPQRDFETNINHLEEQLNYLLQMRKLLNPHYAQPMSLTQLGALQETMASRIDVEIEKLSFPMLNNAILRSADDPATFYYYSSLLTPVEIPESKNPFLVFAEELPGAQKEARITCNRIVEIPIGKTMDETIKLASDILRELKNIRDKGNQIVQNVLKQEEIATSTVELIKKDGSGFIALTGPDACKCSENCLSDCVETEYPCNCDDEGHCDTCCECECLCLGNACPMDQINEIYSELQSNIWEIRNLLEGFMMSIKSLLGEFDKPVEISDGINIYESYFRLNSLYPEGHPNEGEKVPIGKDLCCTADDANCRDDEGNLQVDELEERDYTLIEKLVEIQKLLNYSRKYEDFKKLIDALLEIENNRTKYTNIDLADEEEIENAYRKQRIGKVSIGGIYNLTNCRMLYFDIREYIEKKKAINYLENCRMAKVSTHIMREICNRYDPPYDCDYFNFRIARKRTPLNCYCYDEVWYFDHKDNITSNFFCCVIQP